MLPGAFDPTDPNIILVYGQDRRIWRYPLDGAAPTPLSRQAYSSFSVSPDGRWVAAREAERPAIWLLDRTTGEERSLGLEGHFVGDWRPGNDSFFFTSTSGDIGEYDRTTGETRWWANLQEVSPDFRRTRTVTEVPAMPYPANSAPRLSPDGQQLLFAGGGTNIGTVFRLDLGSGRLYAYPGTETDGFAPFWHPGGDQALYGNPGIFRLNLQTGETSLIGGGYSVNYLAGTSADGRGVAVTGPECWTIGNSK